MYQKSWSARTVRFGVEQNPDFALEPIQPDPRIAFGKGRKLGLAKMNRFFQPSAEDFAGGTEFAAQAHLQGEAAGIDRVPSVRSRWARATNGTVEEGKGLLHAPTLRS